jgi:hypothetical protein
LLTAPPSRTAPRRVSAGDQLKQPPQHRFANRFGDRLQFGLGDVRDRNRDQASARKLMGKDVEYFDASRIHVLVVLVVLVFVVVDLILD